MYSDQNRAFSYAVLASIVLHGALLFGVSQRERPPLPDAEFPPLIARLAEPPAPAALPPAASPKVEAAKPRPRPRPSVPKPVAKPAPAPDPAAPEVLSSSQTTSPSPGPDDSVADTQPLIGQYGAQVGDTASRDIERPDNGEPARETAVQQAPPSLTQTPAPAASSGFSKLLNDRIEQYFHYPRFAVDNNWAGSVKVTLVIGVDGQIASLAVRQSSGYKVLDDQALRSVRRAKEQIEIPAALRGRQLVCNLTVNYEFRENEEARGGARFIPGTGCSHLSG